MNRSPVKAAEDLGFSPVVGQACGDCFSRLNNRDCISRGSHDHLNGGAISPSLSGM